MQGARGFLARTLSGAVQHEEVLEARIEALYDEIDACRELLHRIWRIKDGAR